MKRFWDLVLALFLSCFLLPVFVLLSICNIFFLGFPVFFLQKRTGKDMIPFYLWKFRSMGKEKDQDGNKRSEKERLSPYGRFLRQWSLDELPSFWNIIKGHMSFVGPRPFIIEYEPFYTDRQKKRFQVRPGLTGLAQIRGRNHLSWHRKFAWDLWYVKHQTFALDLYILWKTVFVVLKREGICSPGHVTGSHLHRANSCNKSVKGKI
jgi:lipopolysaccharide/colanic/teichoic acid biosynthesis glycosyltransferase